MADLEDGYARIANEILAEAAKRKFNSTQASIVFYVLRQTYGFQRKSHTMSIGFIAEGTGIHPDQVKRGLKSLIDWNVIRVFEEATFKKARSIGPNKNCEEWTAPMHRGSNDHEGTEQSPQVETITLVGTKQSPTQGTNQSPNKRYFKDSFKDSIYTVFDHWNSKKIIVHRELTQATKSAINARLKVYSPETLMEAIDNYHLCLIDDGYFWSHKWPLKEFMNPRNLDRFLTENDPFTNFKKRSEGKGRTTSQDQISQWARELEEEQRGR